MARSSSSAAWGSTAAATTATTTTATATAGHEGDVELEFIARLEGAVCGTAAESGCTASAAARRRGTRRRSARAWATRATAATTTTAAAAGRAGEDGIVTGIDVCECVHALIIGRAGQQRRGLRSWRCSASATTAATAACGQFDCPLEQL